MMLTGECYSLQVTYLLNGLFARACKSLGGAAEPVDAIQAEVQQLRGLLASKLGQINTNLDGTLTGSRGGSSAHFQPDQCTSSIYSQLLQQANSTGNGRPEDCMAEE
jgi:hypothetical protein